MSHFMTDKRFLLFPGSVTPPFVFEFDLGTHSSVIDIPGRGISDDSTGEISHTIDTNTHTVSRTLLDHDQIDRQSIVHPFTHTTHRPTRSMVFDVDCADLPSRCVGVGCRNQHKQKSQGNDGSDNSPHDGFLSDSRERRKNEMRSVSV